MKKGIAGILMFGLLTICLYAGVKKIVYNQEISGVPSYSVYCTSGSVVVIYKKNGTWSTGGLGAMGHKYDSWSREQIAEYVCN